MLIPVSRGLEEMEEARSAMVIYPTGQSRGLSDLSVVPDPEMPEKTIRRWFTAGYKRRILRETESCKEHGQTDVLLRREDFYSSNLVTWRRHPACAGVDDHHKKTHSIGRYAERTELRETGS